MIGLIIYNVYDCDDKHNNTHNCDDAIDACSGKEAADLLEKATKQLKQTFDDAAYKSDDECDNKHEYKQDNEEIFHGVLI